MGANSCREHKQSPLENRRFSRRTDHVRDDARPRGNDGRRADDPERAGAVDRRDVDDPDRVLLDLRDRADAGWPDGRADRLAQGPVRHQCLLVAHDDRHAVRRDVLLAIRLPAGAWWRAVGRLVERCRRDQALVPACRTCEGQLDPARGSLSRADRFGAADGVDHRPFRLACGVLRFRGAWAAARRDLVDRVSRHACSNIRCSRRRRPSSSPPANRRKTRP